MSLPAIVCLKSAYNNKYLRYRYEEVQTHGLLQFSGENVLDPYAQFEVEKANNCNGLVHLKCRFTNKYLVRWSPNHYWITASAYEPDEDQTSWSCTLFKPIFFDNGDVKKFRLLHVQLGHYACLWRIGAPFDSCLFAGSKDQDQDSCDVMNIVDWNSLFRMPKNVAFKGENGKYLGALMADGKPYLQFSYDDPYHPMAAQKVFPCPNGTVCIMSKHYEKFWRSGEDGYIFADANDPRDTKLADSMFRPNVLDIDVVALLNMGPTWYCKRYTAHIQSLMKVATASVDPFAKLTVIDLGIDEDDEDDEE